MMREEVHNSSQEGTPRLTFAYDTIDKQLDRQIESARAVDTKINYLLVTASLLIGNALSSGKSRLRPTFTVGTGAYCSLLVTYIGAIL